MQFKSSLLYLLFTCVCIVLASGFFGPVFAKNNDYIEHPVNGYVYYEDPSIDFNSIIGADPDRYTNVDESRFTYDDQGRVTSIYVYYEDTGEEVGRFSVDYKGNEAYINGEYFGIYSLEGGQTNPNVAKSSGEVTSEEVTRQSSRTTTSIVGKRIAAIMAPRPTLSSPAPGAAPSSGDNRTPAARRQTSLGYELKSASGLAAGDAAQRWGAWGNLAVAKLENYSDDARYAGGMATSLFGLDCKVTDRLLMGIATGYEHTWLDTTFNDGKIYSNGVTLAPYAAFAILDNLILDVTGSVTWLSNSSSRALNTLDFSADYDSWRTMLSSNLNYYYLLENWSFNASTGFTYSNEYSPEYVERSVFGFRNTVKSADAYVGEWSFGARVGRFFEQAEPYLALTYLWDPWMSGPDGSDNDEVEASLGLNIMASPNFLVTLELTHSFLRKYIQNTVMSCSLRYEF